MVVQAADIERGGSQRPLDCSGGVTVRHREPELRVVLARRHVLVRMGIDSGGDPEEHRRNRVSLLHQSFDPIEFVESIHNEAPHAVVERQLELAHRFVVAVNHQPLGRHAGLQSNKRLALRSDVDPHPLLVGEAGHCQA